MNIHISTLRGACIVIRIVVAVAVVVALILYMVFAL